MMGFVSHWMTKALVSAEADDPVCKALEVMADRQVLAVDGGVFAGWVVTRNPA